MSAEDVCVCAVTRLPGHCPVHPVPPVSPGGVTTPTDEDRLVNVVASAMCAADEDPDCDSSSTDVMATRVVEALLRSGGRVPGYRKEPEGTALVPDGYGWVDGRYVAIDRIKGQAREGDFTARLIVLPPGTDPNVSPNLRTADTDV